MSEVKQTGPHQNPLCRKIKRYDGAQFARALGLIPELGLSATEAFQNVIEAISSDSHMKSILLHDLSTTACQADPIVNELAEPLPVRQLRDLGQALERTCGQLFNNLAKLTALDEHNSMEQRRTQ